MNNNVLIGTPQHWFENENMIWPIPSPENSISSTDSRGFMHYSTLNPVKQDAVNAAVNIWRLTWVSGEFHKNIKKITMIPIQYGRR